MKILLVSHGVTDQSMLGGPGRVAASQANALVLGGHQVSVVTTDATAKGQRTVSPTFDLLDPRVKVRCLPGSTWSHWPGTIGPVHHPGSRQVLLEAIADADVVHCHEWPHLLVQQARRIARSAGKPCVIQPHGSIQPRKGMNRLKHELVIRRYPARAGEIFIAGTKSEEAEIRAALGPRPSIVRIVNPMALPDLGDDSEPRRVRRAWEFPPDTAVLLYGHRVFPNKGLDLLIHAIRLLPTTVDLAIVGAIGDSHFADQCFQLIASSGLDKRVRYFGAVEREQIDTVIRAADIFILPARRDTFPLMVLHAMACARSVVVTNTCQSVELLGDAVALADPTPESIAAAIRPLLEPSRRAELGDRARELVRSHFSPSAVAADLERVYESAA